jgi:acetone carboxylase gamma subunit
MKHIVTEYLRVDLDTELWECCNCGNELGSAKENYKKFTRLYARNPQEIHRPKLDPERYQFTFAPDPRICVIYEFYCPHCSTMMDVEYTVPGHMPQHDIELDLDSVREKLSGRSASERPDGGVDQAIELRANAHNGCHGHSHGGGK